MSVLGESSVEQPNTPPEVRPEEDAPLASHIHRCPPNIWIGHGLTLSVFALSAISLGNGASNNTRIDVTGVGIIVYIVAWIYWLFCVHRIHRILKEATKGAYSIGPWRAIGFQFIPLFSLIWTFIWPKRIAEFVNRRGNSVRMSKYLPGLGFFITAFLPGVGAIAPLHLLILFCTTHYILRKLSRVLPPLAETSTVRRREHQLTLALSAGIGAVFTFKLFQAFWNPLNHDRPGEIFHQLLVIAIVSTGLILFIEPLAEASRSRLGLEEHHARSISRSWQAKVGVFVIVALTSLAHDFLHRQIEYEMDHDPVDTLLGLAGAMIVSSAITYAWVSGASRRKPRAALFGLTTGAVIGLIVVTLILSTTKLHPSQPVEEVSTLTQATQTAAERSAGILGMIAKAASPYQEETLRNQWALDVRKTILPWTLIGLIGGLAVDRRWGRRPSRNVAVAIFLAGALLFPALALLARRLGMGDFTATPAEMAAHIFAVGGWAISLAVFPFADPLFELVPVHVSAAIPDGMNQEPAA